MTQYEEPPARLWKYREWNDHARDLIVHGEIYFAGIEQINDPFEFYWRDQFPKDDAEKDRLVKELCAMTGPNDSLDERRKRYRSLSNDINRLAALRRDGTAPTETVYRHGLFCSSEVYDDLLMWSHYTKKHTGVCVSILPSKITGNRFYPVAYSENIPIIKASEYLKRTDETFDKMARCKSEYWKYEREWRTGHARGARRFDGCVDCVIMGVRMKDSEKAEVRDAVRSSGRKIAVFEASRSETHYRLEIPEIKEFLATAKVPSGLARSRLGGE